MTPTTPPPEFTPRCGHDAEPLCGCEAAIGFQQSQPVTVVPPRCGCGRPEIAGHACRGCAAPQWVDWPTHAGWWWFDTTPMTLVEATKSLGLLIFGLPRVFGREDIKAGRRFLDARLTPPAPPGGRR